MKCLNSIFLVVLLIISLDGLYIKHTSFKTKRNFQIYSMQKNKKITNNIIAITSICSSVLLQLPLLSYAQIPSMDEYNTGSGTVLPGRQRIVDKISINAAITSDTFSIKKLKDSIILIEKLISDSPPNWNEITNAVKLIPKLDVKCFGFSSYNTMSQEFKVTIDQAKAVETVREDLSFNIGQLKDLALANRVYFFNKADLEQQEFIKEAAEVPSSAAVKEGLDFIKDIKAIVNDMETALNT